MQTYPKPRRIRLKWSFGVSPAEVVVEKELSADEN
jgi:hypothetical protein